jgi:hypothetical protein
VDVTEQGLSKRMAKRIDHLARENEQLKSENSALREEFKDFRSLQERLVQAFRDRPTVEVKKRRLGLVRMALLVAGGCALGMRLGRDRYEQMVSAVKERMPGGGDESVLTVPDAEEVQASLSVASPRAPSE